MNRTLLHLFGITLSGPSDVNGADSLFSRQRVRLTERRWRCRQIGEA
jgi:hypothetical protein